MYFNVVALPHDKHSVKSLSFRLLYVLFSHLSLGRPNVSLTTLRKETPSKKERAPCTDTEQTKSLFCIGLRLCTEHRKLDGFVTVFAL